MIKKLLSYLSPIPIQVIPSQISEQLELTWYNGKLLLDTKRTNYSYGNLQKVLKKGLNNIGYDQIDQMQHILVLGVAGGSVVKTLVEDFKFNKQITGVELDPVVIKIAKKHFKIDEISNFDLIEADAKQFVRKTKSLYDLIIIDVFEDCFMPDFLFENEFINNITTILKPKGFILFNTIVLNKASEDRNELYKAQFNKGKFQISSFPNIDDKNELIIIKKEFD